MRRRSYALGSALAATIAVIAAVVRLEPPLAWPVAVCGGEVFTLRLPVTGFDQDDPAWAASSIGGSHESIAEVGCALCSAAMVATWLGAPITPSELNQRLIKSGGYTCRGWLRWQAVADVTGGMLRLTYAGQPDLKRIDDALRNGVPSIIKLSQRRFAHWVVVVGKQGNDYLVNDPLAERNDVMLLSSLASTMLAQREFRAPPPGGWRD